MFYSPGGGGYSGTTGRFDRFVTEAQDTEHASQPSLALDSRARPASALNGIRASGWGPWEAVWEPERGRRL